MSTLTITWAKNEQVTGKFGPQFKTSIKTQEYGDEYIGGYSKYELKVGQTINAEVTEKEYNGKMYKNFKIVAKSAVSADNSVVIKKLDTILEEMQKIKSALAVVMKSDSFEPTTGSNEQMVEDFVPDMDDDF